MLKFLVELSEKQIVLVDSKLFRSLLNQKYEPLLQTT
jgi:hypothetical protein